MAGASTLKRNVPRITEGDEEFRNKFVSWNLADLSYVDIREYLKVKDSIIVPMASVEQHGPHLPLYTDTITAIEVSTRIAEHIAMLHTPPIWMGYSPQHMHGPGEGRGTITVRASTLSAIMYDVGRSLIHHGFNRIHFINGHGSNTKVVDPVLRKLRYETGALISFINPWMENYTGILQGLMENPPEETPGWHASELETSQDMAYNRDLVRMERAEKTLAHVPEWLPRSFAKKDGMPDVEFEGYKYFRFPMDHHEFIESGTIGNPMRATVEKGEEAFRRFSEHCAKGILELEKVEVQVHNREFVDRVL
jgi:creatinine amidohydrolase